MKKQLHEQLIEAASIGNREGVLQALSNGADVNAVKDDKSKLTALSAACKAGHSKIAELLLQRGAATDICGDHGDGGTPLIWAAANGDIPLAQMLLEHGADINFQDSFEWTPLQHACHSGQTEMGLFLLDKGADPFIKDDFYSTTLMQACYGNSVVLVKRLLELGVDPFAEDIEDSDCLLTVQDAPVEIAELLVREGLTPYSHFHWLHCSPILRALSLNNMPLVRYWIKQGADIHSLTQSDSTLVGVACYSQQWDALPQLLEWGIDCILPDEDGHTPLMHLVACEDEFCRDGAELLLQHGACINGQDDDDRSILDMAATPEAREWLLAHGSQGKLQHPDELEAAVLRRYGVEDIADTETLLAELYKRGDDELRLDFVRAVSAILWQRLYQEDELEVQATKQPSHKLWEICRAKYEQMFSRKDACGRTLLARQCRIPGVSPELVNYLRSAIGGEKSRTLDKHGNSALWYALKHGNMAAALEFESDTELLTQPGEDGSTPLQLMFGQPAPLIYRMTGSGYYGSAYTAIVRDGMSVLDRAMLDAHAAGQRFLVNRLIEAGARKELLPTV